MDSSVLAEVLDELLAGWNAFVGDDGPLLSGTPGPRSRRPRRSQQQLVTVMTLTAHVHATAALLRPALPNGLTIVHMPLVRAVFESTVTLVWCDEVADGANALINEGARQRRALRKTVARSRSLEEMASRINVGMGSLPTSSENQAKSVERRCEDVALDGAYAMYRMLSGMGHASVDTIDAYLDEETFVPGRPTSVKSRPGVLGSSFAWSHLVACCLLWSGMVANYLDRSRSRRSGLQRIARVLEVKSELPVKWSAVQRGAES